MYFRIDFTQLYIVYKLQLVVGQFCPDNLHDNFSRLNFCWYWFPFSLYIAYLSRCISIHFKHCCVDDSNLALVVILIRAGLSLDPVALRRLSCVVFRLAFSPCVAESITVAVASHFLLGFPWVWGLMLG